MGPARRSAERQRSQPRRPAIWGRRRRGATLVEYGLISTLYFAFLFGIIEFNWMLQSRNALTNGCARAARLGAVGKTVEQMKDGVRTGSQLNVGNDSIFVEYNSQDDGGGSWTAAQNDPSSGDPPIANWVPIGRPIRVRVAAWPYRFLTGALFAWLPGTNAGTFPISARSVARRE